LVNRPAPHQPEYLAYLFRLRKQTVIQITTTTNGAARSPT
jgi:hypothetical protein